MYKIILFSFFLDRTPTSSAPPRSFTSAGTITVWGVHSQPLPHCTVIAAEPNTVPAAWPRWMCGHFFGLQSCHLRHLIGLGPLRGVGQWLCLPAAPCCGAVVGDNAQADLELQGCLWLTREKRANLLREKKNLLRSDWFLFLECTWRSSFAQERLAAPLDQRALAHGGSETVLRLSLQHWANLRTHTGG